jgi:hypothetical protein
MLYAAQLMMHHRDKWLDTNTIFSEYQLLNKVSFSVTTDKNQDGEV